MTWSRILLFVARILGQLTLLLSPEIRSMIIEGLNAWWERAKETDNAFDDIFVKALFDILDVEERPVDMD
jgi:hypothetical protein